MQQKATSSVVTMLQTCEFPAAVVDSKSNIRVWNQALAGATSTDLDLAHAHGGVPFASLPFVDDASRTHAVEALRRVRKVGRKAKGGGQVATGAAGKLGTQPQIYLELRTKSGEEVAVSMTASVIGPTHGRRQPVALYGQVRGARTTHSLTHSLAYHSIHTHASSANPPHQSTANSPPAHRQPARIRSSSMG